MSCVAPTVRTTAPRSFLTASRIVCTCRTSPSGRIIRNSISSGPEIGPYRYVILDRDSKFDATVITFLKATGLQPKRTSIQSPWQNGTAERWVGSCRRESLDHVIALDERHLLLCVDRMS